MRLVVCQRTTDRQAGLSLRLPGSLLRSFMLRAGGSARVRLALAGAPVSQIEAGGLEQDAAMRAGGAMGPRRAPVMRAIQTAAAG